MLSKGWGFSWSGCRLSLAPCGFGRYYGKSCARGITLKRSKQGSVKSSHENPQNYTSRYTVTAYDLPNSTVVIIGPLSSLFMAFSSSVMAQPSMGDWTYVAYSWTLYAV